MPPRSRATLARQCARKSGGQFLPIAVPIGGGEVIVAWSDQRNGANSQNIYAQRMSVTGSRLWPTVGVPEVETDRGRASGGIALTRTTRVGRSR